jgi:MscS family membrane protein
VVVHPGLPDVVVERQLDGQWKWTRSSIELVESLHAQSFATRLESRMPRVLVGEVLGVKLWQYLAIAMSLVVGLLARRVIHFVATRRLAVFERGEKVRWVGSLVTTIASPGATLVVAGVLRLTYPQLGLPIGASLAMAFAVRTIVVLSFVWVGYRLVDVFGQWLAAKASQTDSKLDDQLVPLLRKSLKVVVVILGTLMVLQNLDVDVGSLLAGLGIGGLAFALAAKDTIANFFGSVMIFVDKPFQIGDWVAVDGCEGIVEEVGFRTTRIRAFDNSLIAIPNMKFTEQKIVNFGARKYRRHFTTLNLTYDTTPEQMQAFVEGVRGIVLAHPKTRKDAFEIHMSGFGAHSLDVMLYYFFEVSTWSAELEGKHEVMVSIMRLAKELGVSFAFPTRTLHIVEAAEPGAERATSPGLPREQLVHLVTAYGPDGERGRELPALVEGRHRPGSYSPRVSSG